eukprot:m.165854 g.165854  ORF g.165854 m.165854 type:complete len:231 (-) comp16607_c0_seq2:2572-3264(-)
MSDDLKAMFRAKMADRASGSAALQALKRKKQEAKLAKMGASHNDEKLKARMRAKAEAQQRLVEAERLQRLEDQQRGVRMHKSVESLPAVATNQREEPAISSAKAARLAKAEKYRRKVKKVPTAVFENHELQPVSKKAMKDIRDKHQRLVDMEKKKKQPSAGPSKPSGAKRSAQATAATSDSTAVPEGFFDDSRKEAKVCHAVVKLLDRLCASLNSCGGTNEVYMVVWLYR